MVIDIYPIDEILRNRLMHLGKSLNPGEPMLLESKEELLFQSEGFQLPDAHILMLLENKGHCYSSLKIVSFLMCTFYLT